MNEAMIKINNLPSNNGLHNNYLLVTQSNETNAETQKVTLAQLISFIKTQLNLDIENNNSEINLDSFLPGNGILIEKNFDTNVATIIWEPKDWIENTNYKVGDFVIYNKQFYRCTVDNIDSSWLEENWELIGSLPEEIIARASVDYYATLNRGGWSGDTPPYIQTLFIPEMTEESSPIIDLLVSPNITQGILEMQQWGFISRMVAEKGIITAYCYEAKPIVDLNIHIKEV